jgi:hypothetical protein
MPTTFDKILGKPLLHTHVATDISGVGVSDVILLTDATEGNATVNLPSVSTVVDKKYIIKKTDLTDHLVTIVPNNTDKIENLSESLVIEFQNSAVQLLATNTGWFII